ncbi:MAG: sigma-70 family RNA polymerase sigma factor [Verrucomicrobiales bacterium]|nr:sigma-70 family RNA polymerase sigma factor [Verrucomicrobiales bacterium]
MSTAAANARSVRPAPTRWTLVARARGETPEARQALGDLCAAYYGVVEEFIRWQTGDPQTARDLTHEFFSRLLGGGGLEGADPVRGRFRSYLFGAVKHFLGSERARRGAAKRGGHAGHLSLEQGGTDTHPGIEIADGRAASPEAEFDRHWATMMLARALDRLAAAMAAEGRSAQFELLKPCLQGASPPSQASLAEALGMSETAVKVAIHRLRKRFREAVKAEIAETLRDPATVGEELRHLVQALAGES